MSTKCRPQTGSVFPTHNVLHITSTAVEGLTYFYESDLCLKLSSCGFEKGCGHYSVEAFHLCLYCSHSQVK